jgi:gluconate kinase
VPEDGPSGKEFVFKQLRKNMFIVPDLVSHTLAALERVDADEAVDELDISPDTSRGFLRAMFRLAENLVD